MYDKYGTEIHMGDLMVHACDSSHKITIQYVMCYKDPVPRSKTIKCVVAVRKDHSDDSPPARYITVHRAENLIVVKPATGDHRAIDVMEDVLDQIYEFTNEQ